MDIATKSPEKKAEHRHDFAAWVGLMAGPVGWIIHLQAVYALVPWVCLSGRHWVLHAVTVATIVLIAAGGWQAVRTWRREGREWPSDEHEGKPAARRTMAALGMLNTALFLLIIVAQEIATFYIDPCRD